MRLLYENEQVLNEAIGEYLDPELLELDLREINKHLHVEKINETKLRVYYDKKSMLTIDIVFDPDIQFVLEDYLGKKQISTYDDLKATIIRTVNSEIK